MIVNLPNEDWKDIPEYEGYYQASSLGRIKSVARMVANQWVEGKHPVRERIMKPFVDQDGYHKNIVSRLNKKFLGFTHRFVALAFIPNPEDKEFVNHKNGIKDDNRVENLEWVTHRENTDHAVKNNLIAVGENNGMSKMTNAQATEIKILINTTNYSNRKISKLCNVSFGMVNRIRKKETWNHIKVDESQS